MKFDILKNYFHVGDNVSLVSSGTEVQGSILELNDGVIVIQSTLGDVLAIDSVGVESCKKMATSSSVVADEPDPNKALKSSYCEALESINEICKIDPASEIKTNATITRVTSGAVEIETDDNQHVICGKGVMVGYDRHHAIPGTRVFAKPSKKACYISVRQMTYSEVLERFKAAFDVTPHMRIPIINSILGYYKSCHFSPETRSLLKQIPSLKVERDDSAGKMNTSESIHGKLNSISKMASAGNEVAALQQIEGLLKLCSDEKQKAAILLRKAQILSSISDFHNAINAYKELIEYSVTINSPANNQSHLFTELARLQSLVGEKAQAVHSISEAVRLNPSNAIARKLLSSLNIKERDENKNSGDDVVQEDHMNLSPMTISFYKEGLVDDDIKRLKFTDSEIKARNGVATGDIAKRLLDQAHESEDTMKYLESAKAFASLPAGSYDVQDYVDAVVNYSMLKSDSLLSTYRSLVEGARTSEDLSNDELSRIKDSVVCYYLEAIDNLSNDDVTAVMSLFNDILRIELSSRLSDKAAIINCLDMRSVDDFIPEASVGQLIIIVNTIIYCTSRSSILSLALMSTGFYNILNDRVLSSVAIRERLLESQISTKAERKVSVRSSSFLMDLITWGRDYTKTYHERFRKLVGKHLNLFALDSLEKCIKGLNKVKFQNCICQSDKKTISSLDHFIKICSLYKNASDDERLSIRNNAESELKDIIAWNTEPTTNLGRFLFTPLLADWLRDISTMVKKAQKIDCPLSLSLDSPFFTVDSQGKNITVAVINTGDQIADGFRLGLWIGQDLRHGLRNDDNQLLLPKQSRVLKFVIPKDWGDEQLYDINYAIAASTKGQWTTEVFGTLTVSQPRSLRKDIVIRWKESGAIDDKLFKGRDELVDDLKYHYCSDDRHAPYVLYGLSRTGKSCILDHLASKIDATQIVVKGRTRSVCSVNLDLAAIESLARDREHFWDRFFRAAYKEIKEYFEKMKCVVPDSLKDARDFDALVQWMDDNGLYPLFMFDEFSYMRTIIDRGYMNVGFLQHMRKLSADDGLASFIFAGTYDIKDLIRDPRYNIAGAFVYLKEPEKPVFEISQEAAEELINIMGDDISFSPAAIHQIHKLSGDVPFWIQKICLNCAYYAIENNTPVIGTAELEDVVSRLSGERLHTSGKTRISSLGKEAFENTQYLSSDPDEVKLLFTSIAHLMRKGKNVEGVTHEQMRNLWQEYGVEDTDLKVIESIELLRERATISRVEKDDLHYYRFSLDLFRRWWSKEHADIGLELSSFRHS